MPQIGEAIEPLMTDRGVTPGAISPNALRAISAGATLDDLNNLYGPIVGAAAIDAVSSPLLDRLEEWPIHYIPRRCRHD